MGFKYLFVQFRPAYTIVIKSALLIRILKKQAINVLDFKLDFKNMLDFQASS